MDYSRSSTSEECTENDPPPPTTLRHTTRIWEKAEGLLCLSSCSSSVSRVESSPTLALLFFHDGLDALAGLGVFLAAHDHQALGDAGTLGRRRCGAALGLRRRDAGRRRFFGVGRGSGFGRRRVAERLSLRGGGLFAVCRGGEGSVRRNKFFPLGVLAPVSSSGPRVSDSRTICHESISIRGLCRN